MVVAFCVMYIYIYCILDIIGVFDWRVFYAFILLLIISTSYRVVFDHCNDLLNVNKD